MQRRRRRISRLLIRFMLIAVCVMAANWKFGWLPVGLHFSYIDWGKTSDNAPSRSTDTTGDLQLETNRIDPIVFNSQTEPPIHGKADQTLTPRRSSRFIESRQREHSPAHPTPLSQPLFIPEEMAEFVSAARNSSQQHSSRATQVSNEVERPSNRTEPDQLRLRNSNSRLINLDAIDRLIETDDVVAAHCELSKFYWSDPKSRPLIRERIEITAKSIYFSPQPHYMQPYVVQPGDQLRRIAGRYRVPWTYLAKLNQVEPRKIRPGLKLKVINGPFSALIDLNDFDLTIHAHGHFVRRYRIGIGKDDSTPIGKFKVIEKFVNPQYTDPAGQVIEADDSNNPLGECWIGIGDGFGIHGTIDPDSVGRAESRGCIRMHNADVEEVFGLLRTGSAVVIRTTLN